VGVYETHHIDPPHAVKMMKAVQAKMAVPIHFGTFVLTFEPVLEPVEWLERINEGLNFGRWNIGDTVTS
jgi:L-ascorbate metabolism protein UlaG (beta-lactamase superfamily)